MEDSELLDYISKNVGRHGLPAVKEQLIKDGVPPEEIEAAIVEIAAGRRSRRRLGIFAVLVGTGLLIAAVYLGKTPARPERDAGDAAVDMTDFVFRGHYGYIFKLPPGYRAHSTFRDAHKIREVVHIFPQGTDHTHFIHEGLYGDLGILRLEVLPRRVPQGFIGVETLKSWVTQKLDHEKAQYDVRSLIVHGRPAFIVTIEKPFKSARAHIVGQKVRYLLVGGEENTLFNNVLSSLVEVSPHDRPGTGK